jgi:hypothetical protein
MQMKYGPQWTADELKQDFKITGHLTPYVFVRRLNDGRRGVLSFRHSPRIYFDYKDAND